MFLKQQMLEILDQFTSSKKKIQNMAQESDSNHESDEDDDEENQDTMPNEPTRVFDFVLFQYTFTKVIQRYKYLNTKAKTANASKKMEEHKEKVEEYFAKDQDSDRGVDEENEFVNQDIINECDVQAEFEWYENLKNKNKEV